MKLLILSDNHRTSLREILSKRYDHVFHCGDYGMSLGELIGAHVDFVCGNCDAYGPRYKIVEVYGKKVLILHGNQENVKYDLTRLIYKALEQEVKVCFFGHTHQQECFVEQGILFLNPGSYPEGYAEITEEEIYLYHNQIVKTIEYKW